MEVGWSRFRGFEGRSEAIMLAIEALEFIILVRQFQDRTSKDLEKDFIRNRFESFNEIFSIFMPLFPKSQKAEFEQALKYSDQKKYSKIRPKTLRDMERYLEKWNSVLSAEQSRDIDIFKAMR